MNITKNNVDALNAIITVEVTKADYAPKVEKVLADYKKKFEEINKIFIEKKHYDISATACDYVFRDILIFKHKSKTIGIAKICFGCSGNQIVGTKANTEEFGMDGDYEKLKEILNRE